MVELKVDGNSIENAKTIAKILEMTGYKVYIIDRRDKYSHRHDTYLQIHDNINNKEFQETYCIDVVMNSDGETIKEVRRSQNKPIG